MSATFKHCYKELDLTISHFIDLKVNQSIISIIEERGRSTEAVRQYIFSNTRLKDYYLMLYYNAPLGIFICGSTVQLSVYTY